MLPVDECWVDSDEPAAGSESAMGQIHEFADLSVIHMVENADRHCDRTVGAGCDEVLSGCCGERAASSELFLGRIDVPLARIEAHVVDRREVVENVSGAASDVEDAVGRCGAKVFSDEDAAEFVGADESLSELIGRGKGENRPPAACALSWLGSD